MGELPRRKRLVYKTRLAKSPTRVANTAALVPGKPTASLLSELEEALGWTPEETPEFESDPPALRVVEGSMPLVPLVLFPIALA